MRFRPRILFTLGVMIVAAYAVYAARNWPLGTGLFPWFVGIPVLALAVIQMILDTYQIMSPPLSVDDSGVNAEIQPNVDCHY